MLTRKHFLLAFNSNKDECTPTVSEVSKYSAAWEVINCVELMSDRVFYFAFAQDNQIVFSVRVGATISNFDVEFTSSDQSEVDFLADVAIVTLNVIRSLLKFPLLHFSGHQKEINRALECFKEDDGYSRAQMMVVCFLVMETDMTTAEIQEMVELSKKFREEDIPALFEIALNQNISLREALEILS